MKQEVRGGNGNVQIIGNGNTVFNRQPEQESPPDTPHMTSCPACHKEGIYYQADTCPRCQYSFLKERVRIQDEERRKRETTLQILVVLGFAALFIGCEVSTRFNVSFWRGMGWGSWLVIVLSVVGLLLWSRASTAIKRWQGKL